MHLRNFSKFSLASLLVVFVLLSCDNKIKYNNQIIDFDYKIFDGVVIYNRTSEVMIFQHFKARKNELVFIGNDLKIRKNQIITYCRMKK